MKIKDLIEASASVDEYRREKARELVNYIYNYLLVENTPSSLVNVFRFNKSLEAAVFDIYHEKYFIELFFIGSEQIGGGVSEKEIDNHLQIQLEGFNFDFILDTYEEIIMNLLNQFEFSFPQYRSTLIHEFIHVLDVERLTTDSEWAAHPKRDEEGVPQEEFDFVKYANNPLELNAYYQEAIDDFENVVSDVSQLFQIKDFEWFKEHFFNRRLPPEIVDNLTEENRKRIIKRLWDYYQEYK